MSLQGKATFKKEESDNSEAFYGAEKSPQFIQKNRRVLVQKSLLYRYKSTNTDAEEMHPDFSGTAKEVRRCRPNCSMGLSTRTNMERCMHFLLWYIPQIQLEGMHTIQLTLGCLQAAKVGQRRTYMDHRLTVFMKAPLRIY